MAKPADDIIEALLKAFPARRPAGLLVVQTEKLGYDDDDYEQTKRAFRDKDDWTTIDPALLDEEYTALSFLSREALRFYIPAYLRADLRGALRTAAPSFHLSHGLAPAHDAMLEGQALELNESLGLSAPPRFDFAELARQNWDTLDGPQAAAIADYLEWVVERDGPDIADDAAEALATYWRPRRTAS